MTVFVPLSTQPVLFNGAYQIGAILQVFDAQTLTPRTVYKDGLATIPWLQATPGSPVPAGAYVTDGSARIPVGFVVGNPYRIRCIASNGMQIFDIDNLPGDTAVGGGGGGGGGGGATLSTGDYVWSHTTDIVIGRVRANGKTIGDASSIATERANADTQNLFVFLWNSDASLAVSGGRGASAIADFNAHKTLALPDMNGRLMAGIDGMGSSSTGRLAGGIFASGNATTLGSTGGEAAHALVNAENATHGHTGVTLANAAFQMSFTTASAGAHNHPASTAVAVGAHSHAGSTAPGHNHTFTTGNAGSHNHAGLTQGADTNFQMNSVGVSISKTFAYSFPTSASGAGGFQSPLSDASLNMGLSGVWFQDHHHAITYDGDHTHSGTTNLSGALTLSINSDGAHGHSLSINLDGAHVHTGVTNLGGSHTHGFVSDLSGGGAAHNNLAPFLLATCCIVL